MVVCSGVEQYYLIKRAVTNILLTPIKYYTALNLYNCRKYENSLSMTGPPVHKARSFKGNASEDFAVEELVQIPDLNPIEHL